MPVKKTTKATKKTTTKVVAPKAKVEKVVAKTAAKKSAAPVKATKTVKSVAPVAPHKVSIKDVSGFLLTATKQQIIDTFSLKVGDTGSPEVQVALASHKIVHLASHLEENPKDNHSRRGLLKVISKRRRILQYLQSKDQPRYEEVIKGLNLKK